MSGDSGKRSPIEQGARLEAQGRFAEAERAYRAAVEVDELLAALHLGRFLIDRGRPAEAVPVLEQAVRDGRTECQLTLGDALADPAEPDAAYAAYLRAGEGGDAYGWYWAGRVLRWLGRLDDALVPGRRALDGGAMSVAHFASWLADAKHYDEAVDLLRAAGDDGDGDALVELGAIEQERGRLVAAEVVLRRAVAANASDAHVYLANVLKGLGRPQEGLAVLREGADQGDPSAQLQLANELAREDIDNPEIEALLRRAIERGDEEAETNLGIHLLELARREEAIEILKRTADQGDELARQTLLDVSAHPPEASE